MALQFVVQRFTRRAQPFGGARHLAIAAAQCVFDQVFFHLVDLLGQRGAWADGLPRQGVAAGQAIGQAQRPAFGGVFQLAHIARPIVRRPARQVGRRPVGWRALVAAGGVVQKRRHQQRDVFAALAQGRDVQADHVQPVKQILPKLPGLGGGVQIHLAGRHHPTIHGNGRIAAQPLNAALLQHPQ